MPHLRIEYSTGLEDYVDITELCNILSDTLKETNLFPTAGIRVRAFRATNFSIADKDESNLFCDMHLRMGQGRSKNDRIVVGEVMLKRAKQIFIDLLEREYFALSIEIVEIEKAFSWKSNSIHRRLA